MDQLRQRRISDQMHEVLSEIFLRELSDPRLYGLTIMSVKVDRELSHANIFVAALGEPERAKEILQGLDRANGFLRRQVANRMRLRTMPQLHFHWDELVEQSHEVASLLDDLVIPDAPEEDASVDDSDA